MPDIYVDISCITIPQPAMYVILSVQLDKNINIDSERNTPTEFSFTLKMSSIMVAGHVHWGTKCATGP